MTAKANKKVNFGFAEIRSGRTSRSAKDARILLHSKFRRDRSLTMSTTHDEDCDVEMGSPEQGSEPSDGEELRRSRLSGSHQLTVAGEDEGEEEDEGDGEEEKEVDRSQSQTTCCGNRSSCGRWERTSTRFHWAKMPRL